MSPAGATLFQLFGTPSIYSKRFRYGPSLDYSTTEVLLISGHVVAGGLSLSAHLERMGLDFRPYQRDVALILSKHQWLPINAPC
jgi:hypothetical protein